MSTPEAWLTPEAVASYLDLPTIEGEELDDNLVLSTAAWKAAVERRHPVYLVDGVYSPTDDIRLGAIRAAALTFQSRNAPSGFAGYGDETMLFDSLGAQRAEIMRQLRWRRPALA